MYKTKVRNAYSNMMRRCYNPADKSYPNYGGRGIVVCDSWRRGLDFFRRDMGDPPTSAHTLDRIDNDGPYSPENCQWATNLEQQTRRTDNVYITAAGETLHLAEWARRAGVTAGTIYRRRRDGWTDTEAVLGRDSGAYARGFGRKRGRKAFLVSDDGIVMTLKEHAARLGVGYGTLYARFKRGDFGAKV